MAQQELLLASIDRKLVEPGHRVDTAGGHHLPPQMIAVRAW
jgi:hypothetical protein